MPRVEARGFARLIGKTFKFPGRAAYIGGQDCERVSTSTIRQAAGTVRLDVLMFRTVGGMRYRKDDAAWKAILQRFDSMTTEEIVRFQEAAVNKARAVLLTCTSEIKKGRF